MQTRAGAENSTGCEASFHHHQLGKGESDGLQGESITVDSGDPLPAAGKQEYVHYISWFFLFVYSLHFL